MECAVVLRLIEVFPIIIVALKLYLTMPITSCEAESNFSKLFFIKNKFRSTIAEELLNTLLILSLHNYITGKLSCHKIISDYWYVARMNKKEYFVKCVSCSMYSHMCLK